MSDNQTYSIEEFERESRYLETLVWEALAISPGERVLFCGYGDDAREVRRAIEDGADVSVIEHRSHEMMRFADVPAKLVRGSTSVIPARDNSFDVAVSFHYLHEIDPFFHSQVLAELARVARRIALVEPAPPADPLGKRIALLYSQAKRESGQFEYYQPIDYWKKLLSSVKADISQHVFAFTKTPPREYLYDSVQLLLRTMEVEEAPKEFMEELRAIADRSDAVMLPPPRFVLIGAAAGELPAPKFSVRPPAPMNVARPRAAAAPPATATGVGYEFPPVDAPSAPAQPPAAAPAIPPPAAAPPHQPSPPPAPAAPGWQAPVEPNPLPRGTPSPLPPAFTFQPGSSAPPSQDNPFGAPPTPEAPAAPVSPFGAPFAIPEQQTPSGFGAPPEGVPPVSSWSWEPPEGEES